jgi:hypothetical protein
MGANHSDRTASSIGFCCIAEVLAALRGITESAAVYSLERMQRAEIEEHIRNAQRGLATLKLALPYLSMTPERVA